MVSKRLIVLPHELIERSKRYGEDVVRGYRAGRNAASLAVSSHGAEGNAELQGEARMAECAFALFAGRDPITALNWSVYCDDGADVVAWNERYDVKATKWFGHYLIWPVNKRHIFESKKFDALQLVKCKPPEFEIAGWVPKCVFALEHRIAPAGHKLTAGTWYMRDNELWGCG